MVSLLLSNITCLSSYGVWYTNTHMTSLIIHIFHYPVNSIQPIHCIGADTFYPPDRRELFTVGLLFEQLGP